MPQHRSAAKRVRQNARARERNRKHRSRMRTLVKRVMQMEDLGEAKAAYTLTQSYLDRLATKGVIHPNKAANCKRQLQKKLASLATS